MKEKKVKYYLNASGEFVIENYNFAKPFANFFPGIAGKYGIPMWTFYVNRGQGIASFGTKDKDHSILEFFPANKAWQMASSHGFRTFLKINNCFYEPFQNGFTNLRYNLSNKMYISSCGLTLQEDNLTLGLSVKVEYFNIPNESYAGLARIITMKNLNRSQKKIQLLDGLPQITPFGTSNLFLKKLGRTIEAWMQVKNLDRRVPFYKLDVDPTDRPEVIHIKGGNFYLGFDFTKNKARIIRPIIDPSSIFGPVTDFSCPRFFLAKDNFKYPAKEITASKMPCAFLLAELKLGSQEEKIFYSLVGNARSIEILNSSLKKITAPEYLARKKEENQKLVADLEQDIATLSSSREFNLYAAQTYLDNIIRGGYPLIFDSQSGKSVFYLYSRKHGDLERDYNKFHLQPAYFSQGNGNYRDMNQNRRSDPWFNPLVEEENLVYFFSLLQLDGFNPLVVKGASFLLDQAADLKKGLTGLVEEKKMDLLISFLQKPFTPGELIFFSEEHKIILRPNADQFLGIVISNCLKIQEAEHGEGFWIDHWHYNLDLLESFLGVYPERKKEIFFEERVFSFFDNTEIVKPRSEKYLLKDGSVRQLHAIAPDNTKREMIRKRTLQPHLVRTQYGKGEIYQTTLINKLLCLLANKLASLDPFGAGIEMEADKPNWYDALNGLPALFGSSACETFELKRLCLLVKDALSECGCDKITITQEFYDFLNQLNGLIEEYFNESSVEKEYSFWDKSHTLKEEYLQKTKLGLSGKEIDSEVSGLIKILENALKKIDLGLKKAQEKPGGLYCAYFINEPTEYEPLKAPFVRVTKFRQKRLPLFLESQMHALRISSGLKEAKNIYQATKQSRLYDRKLKMYKVTAQLKKMPEEIGRCRVFTPGWLENESIWLHMEYKYLLEILKSRLYEDFHREFKNVLIPFQNPARYGRSILENSSFLVSSAFPDTRLHGNGYVARLSGSTAEFLQIWLKINLGDEPFFLDENKALNLCFQPVLPGWLFKKDGSYSFNFLSKIKVVYHNPERKNTFGRNSAQPSRISFSDAKGKPVEISSATIPSPYAAQVRSCQIKQIDIDLD